MSKSPESASAAADGSSAQRSRGAVTLVDIARAAGVSRSTVSLVLRGSPLVRDSTRRRVEAELDRQRYVYNHAAATLRRRTSTCVALVINDLSNPFFAEFAAGAAEALGEAGYVTLLGSTGESEEQQRGVLASLLEHAPAGMILSPAKGSDPQALRESLARVDNVLLFNRELDVPEWDVLALDNAAGAEAATRHLLERGHRRIAFFGDHVSSACRQRCEGYVLAMQEAGLPTQILAGPSRREDVSQFAVELLASLQGDAMPSAMVCYNDSVALGLMQALQSAGLVPGRDLAITGFDDVAEAALVSPGLSTVAAEPRQRGREAVAQLLERIANPDLPVRRVVAPVSLRVRASSAEPYAAPSPGATRTQVSSSTCP